MREETVQYFTEKEEEFASLLIEIGMNKNVAKMLVFLANTSVATSRSIERGTGLRQPEVSLAMKYLKDRGLITITEKQDEKRGRPKKAYVLTKPITEIENIFKEKKKSEINKNLTIIKELKNDLFRI